MYTRLLVPLDGSQASERALSIAQQILPRTSPELFLVHVVDPPRESAAHMHQTYLDGVTEKLRNLIAQSPSKSDTGKTVITPVLLHGDPSSEIIDFAHKKSISLIIMSTRNRAGIRRWALGSVSEKVYRQTNCSCVLIGANGEAATTRPERAINRILVPVGRSGDLQHFLTYVNAFDTRVATEAVFLQSVPPVVSIDMAEYQKVAHEFTESAYVDRLELARKEEAVKHLSTFAEVMKSKGIAAATVIKIGSSEDNIIKYASENNIGLIALPAEGQSSFGYWILGKLVKNLLREGKTPILVVKPVKPG